MGRSFVTESDVVISRFSYGVITNSPLESKPVTRRAVMSTETVSRTCADVIQLIENRTDIPPRRERDLISAVRRMCRLLQRDPSDVPANPDQLRRELAHMSPGGSALSSGSLRNLKSLVGKALITVAVTSVPRRSHAQLAPTWRDLLAAVHDRHQRYRLSHFAHYSSERDIDPAEVDNKIVDCYRRNLLSSSLVHGPTEWCEMPSARGTTRKPQRRDGTCGNCKSLRKVCTTSCE